MRMVSESRVVQLNKRDRLCPNCVRGICMRPIFDNSGKTIEIRSERCTTCYATGWIGPRHKGETAESPH